jgi:hypothetical protein
MDRSVADARAKLDLSCDTDCPSRRAPFSMISRAGIHRPEAVSQFKRASTYSLTRMRRAEHP